MSLSESTTSSLATAETSSGLFAEAIGGIATMVLAILALSGVSAEYLLSIAIIVFGAALLIEGTSLVTDFTHVLSARPEALRFQVGASGISAVFLTGISGIILGVLTLLGVGSHILPSAAIIVFGSAMLLTSSAAFNLHSMKARSMGDAVATELVSGTAGGQVLAGLAAMVLGIVAIAGTAAPMLDAVALIVLGAAILATGNGVNNAVTGMMHLPSRV